MGEDSVVAPGSPTVSETKAIHDRVCDLVLFAMAGGLIAGLAYMGTIPPAESASLTGVLVGAAAMYIKGK